MGLTQTEQSPIVGPVHSVHAALQVSQFLLAELPNLLLGQVESQVVVAKS